MTEHEQNSRTTQTNYQVVSGHAATLLTAVVAVGLIVLVRQTPSELPDFSAIEDIPARKEAFFSYLVPVLEAENQWVLEQRSRLLGITERIRAGDRLGWLDRRWLSRLAQEYEVSWRPDLSEDERMETIERLERRVDTIPVPLALAQAATESGWGQSRFAQEGNNLFGHWCFDPGCGLVPARRSEEAAHEVAAFDNVSESVSRYLHNLNTHEAYAPLRAIRAQLRQRDEPLTAMALADGLAHYSERRADYVEEIKTVIEVNRPIIDQVRETL